MHLEDLLDRFNSINMWKRKNEVAPHKPLLLLYALSKVYREEPRLISFGEIKDNVGQLLRDFGPPRKTRASDPFVYLTNDNIWEINKPLNTKDTYSDKSLLLLNVKGGFPEDIYQTFLANKEIVRNVAQNILDKSFPESMHDDLLKAVGLDYIQITKRTRDPEFRKLVLIAYEYKCAVCSFSVRLGDSLIGLEAAHIKWHQAGGPDIESNGLALCSMHHKLFDRGAFTITPKYEIKVAQSANGAGGLDEWLLRYHGKTLSAPQSRDYQPAEEYVKWHRTNVFRSPSRT